MDISQEEAHFDNGLNVLCSVSSIDYAVRKTLASVPSNGCIYVITSFSLCSISRSICLSIRVHMNDGSRRSKSPFLTCIEMEFRSHRCTAGVRLSQIGDISVNTPLIFGHASAHCLYRIRSPQK